MTILPAVCVDSLVGVTTSCHTPELAYLECDRRRVGSEAGNCLRGAGNGMDWTQGAACHRHRGGLGPRSVERRSSFCRANAKPPSESRGDCSAERSSLQNMPDWPSPPMPRRWKSAFRPGKSTSNSAIASPPAYRGHFYVYCRRAVIILIERWPSYPPTSDAAPGARPANVLSAGVQCRDVWRRSNRRPGRTPPGRKRLLHMAPLWIRRPAAHLDPATLPLGLEQSRTLLDLMACEKGGSGGRSTAQPFVPIRSGARQPLAARPGDVYSHKNSRRQGHPSSVVPPSGAIPQGKPAEAGTANDFAVLLAQRRNPLTANAFSGLVALASMA